MEVCFFTTHTCSCILFIIGPLLFGLPSSCMIEKKRKKRKKCALGAFSHFTRFTGLPKSSGHCSSAFAILSHFLNRSKLILSVMTLSCLYSGCFETNSLIHFAMVISSPVSDQQRMTSVARS